jgi:hypothetical protein
MIYCFYRPNINACPMVLLDSTSTQLWYGLVKFFEIVFEQIRRLKMATIKTDTLKTGFIIICFKDYDTNISLVNVF